MLFRATRIFLATTAHCHDRTAIKIYITHFTRIFNDHLRGGGGGGVRPDYFVKLDFEIAVDQQTSARD